MKYFAQLRIVNLKYASRIKYNYDQSLSICDKPCFTAFKYIGCSQIYYLIACIFIVHVLVMRQYISQMTQTFTMLCLGLANAH